MKKHKLEQIKLDLERSRSWLQQVQDDCIITNKKTSNQLAKPSLYDANNLSLVKSPVSAKLRIYQQINTLLETIKWDFGGGCPFEKASIMADLIFTYNLKTTVEIGVYRGRSLLPIALAHKLSTHGIAYGIDPYKLEEALENDTPFTEDIEKFCLSLDFDSLHKDVLNLIESCQVVEHCILLRKTSEEAISYFIDNDIYFDLLHIDGNHDTDKVMLDVNLYLPRIKAGGFIVMDDCFNWESVNVVYTQLKSQYSVILERFDLNRGADYAILQLPQN
jgi:predicted O-methyltransferase YrrM